MLPVWVAVSPVGVAQGNGLELFARCRQPAQFTALLRHSPLSHWPLSQQPLTHICSPATTKRTARRFHVSPGRISQMRRELEAAWRDFLGNAYFG